MPRSRLTMDSARSPSGATIPMIRPRTNPCLIPPQGETVLPMTAPTTSAATSPAMVPSHVLPGLTLGAIGREPTWLPAK